MFNLRIFFYYTKKTCIDCMGIYDKIKKIKIKLLYFSIIPITLFKILHNILLTHTVVTKE